MRLSIGLFLALVILAQLSSPVVSAQKNPQAGANGGAGIPQGSEESIRMLIRTFANARNSHDGQTIANLYSEGGEWIASHGRTVRGRPALANLWGGLEGQVQRTVESIDFAGPNIAVVRVVTQYWEPVGRHHETFIFVKDTATWEIRVHQSVD